jgi:hypothetical protein
LGRAASECQIKNGRITTRQQISVNTAFIDGSQVYGSTHELAKNLKDLTSKYYYCISPLPTNRTFTFTVLLWQTPDHFIRQSLRTHEFI